MDYLLDDLKRAVVRVGANERWYEHRWLGVTIWQLPEDLVRLQEVCFDVQPDWIVETGTKFGGSAIFFASLLEMMGRTSGGVVTIDTVRTEEASTVLSTHALRRLVRSALIGDAAAGTTIAQVRHAISSYPAGRVLVFLDDYHGADHVYREMQLYAPLVTVGSYLIVADTVSGDLANSPAGTPTSKYPYDITLSNPRVAVQRFLAERDDFVQDDRFVTKGVGNFPDGFLRRTR
jgi:cephalosporin hydroxylase